MFTSEKFLEAPRRGNILPNSTGSLALYTESAYSFETHSTRTGIYVFDVATLQSTLVTDDDCASEPNWLNANLFMYLKSAEKETVSLIVSNADDLTAMEYTVATFPGSVHGLKCKLLADASVALILAGKTTPENQVDVDHDVHIHDSSYFVRHWSSYDTGVRNTLFYGFLRLSNGKYALVESGLRNLLEGSGLESPMPPFCDMSDSDVGSSGIVFISKDPKVNPALTTASNVYYAPFEGDEVKRIHKLEVEYLHGAAARPVFSPDGTKLAYLKMKDPINELDKNRIILVKDLSQFTHSIEIFASDNGKGAWGLDPRTITWSSDAKSLYARAESKARAELFKINIESPQLPMPLTEGVSIGDVRPLGPDDQRLFVTGSTMLDTSIYSILSHPSSNTERASTNLLSKLSLTSNTSLARSQISEIYYTSPGTPDPVQSWLITPPSFDSSKKHPLIVMIHGGPDITWLDADCPTWCYSPLVFASHGYCVLLPNISGSCGFGQAHHDSIFDGWGNKPYTELCSLITYVETSMPFIDTSRMVAHGQSFGGYMINWIQGHPLGRKFKALVCDNAVFSLLSKLAGTDEACFSAAHFGGYPEDAEARKTYERWDPSRFVEHWDTPQMVVASERDYRVPFEEGLGTFRALQRRGVQTRFVRVSGEGHGLFREVNLRKVYSEVLGWLGRFVGADEFNMVEGRDIV